MRQMQQLPLLQLKGLFSLAVWFVGGVLWTVCKVLFALFFWPELSLQNCDLAGPLRNWVN
jgi:hypothetical protein